MAGRAYGVDALDKEVISVLGGAENDGVRIHHAPQNSVPFKTYKLLISVTFHLMFFDCC